MSDSILRMSEQYASTKKGIYIGDKHMPIRSVFKGTELIESIAVGDNVTHQAEAYVRYDQKNKTLTFCYDGMKNAGSKEYDDNISCLTYYELPTTRATAGDGEPKPDWLSMASNITKVIINPEFKYVKPTNFDYWFLDMTKLTSIEGLTNLNTCNCTSMRHMFTDCELLTELDCTSFDTSKVVDMSDMFGGCEAITAIYVSDKFVTNEVTSLNMFYNCTKLPNYDQSYEDASMAKDSSEGGYLNLVQYFTIGDNSYKIVSKQYNNGIDFSGDLDYSSDTDFTIPANDPSTSISLEKRYSRTVIANLYQSLCLPFTFNTNDVADTTFYKIKGWEDTTLKIIKVTGEILAGTPLVFISTTGTLEISTHDNTTVVKEPLEDNYAVGSFKEIDVPIGCYFLSGGKYYPSRKGVKMRFGRLYIKPLSEVSTASLTDDESIEINIVEE